MTFWSLNYIPVSISHPNWGFHRVFMAISTEESNWTAKEMHFWFDVLRNQSVKYQVCAPTMLTWCNKWCALFIRVLNQPHESKSWSVNGRQMKRTSQTGDKYMITGWSVCRADWMLRRVSKRPFMALCADTLPRLQRFIAASRHNA